MVTRRLLFACAAVPFSLAACADILAIQDAEVDPTFHPGTGGASSSSGVVPTLCETYCDTVMTNCTETFAVYTTRETCLAVCAHLPEGTPGDEAVDTVQCRLRNAELSPTEPSFYCSAAGPGGNGVCGSNCESMCYLTASICTGELDPWATTEACMADCGPLTDLNKYSTDPNQEMYEGATVQCRLFHLSAAAEEDTKKHCSHVGGTEPCVDEEAPPP